MDCRKFKELINDFIFDKMEYVEDIQRFIEHFKKCEHCNEELRLFYNIRRGLADVDNPLIDESPKDTDEELDLIISYYDDYFNKGRTRKILFVSSIVTFMLFFVIWLLFEFNIILI